jgi:hypothetical protein
MIRNIKLLAEYDSYPLWDVDDPDNINPDDLPLTEGLVVDLLAWADEYDSGLNREDGSLIKFHDTDSRLAFNEVGRGLAKRLRDELGANFEVIYVEAFV